MFTLRSLALSATLALGLSGAASTADAGWGISFGSGGYHSGYSGYYASPGFSGYYSYGYQPYSYGYSPGYSSYYHSYRPPVYHGHSHHHHHHGYRPGCRW